MTALVEHDRTRLVRLLGMLGSDHDGERANAGALAHRFLAERKLTWDDVVVPAGRNGSTGSAHQDQSKQPPRNWRDVVGECLAKPFALNDWELGFLMNMTKWGGCPSPKQEASLRKIADRLGILYPESEWP